VSDQIEGQVAESGRIEGQVAQILNTRELVINRGSEHGVKEGMVFAVLSRRGVGITDPETGASLGDVPLVKVAVRATRVFPQMTVARTFRQYRSALSVASVFAEQLQGGRETLRLKDAPFAELSEGESFVKRSDPIMELHQGEYDEVIHR
jgi:hypothetical protein